MINEIDQVQPHWQQVERDRSLQKRRHRFSYSKTSKSKSREEDGPDANDADQESSGRRVDVRV